MAYHTATGGSPLSGAPPPSVSIGELLVSSTPALVAGVVIEATTLQIDNLVVPLVVYAALPAMGIA